MLKLHHLNLMNEIQETALMLNLYEQKQLMRQQQEQRRQLQELRALEARNTGSGATELNAHGPTVHARPMELSSRGNYHCHHVVSEHSLNGHGCVDARSGAATTTTTTTNYKNLDRRYHVDESSSTPRNASDNADDQAVLDRIQAAIAMSSQKQKCHNRINADDALYEPNKRPKLASDMESNRMYRNQAEV
jgi:hypothetical protein